MVPEHGCIWMAWPLVKNTRVHIRVVFNRISFNNLKCLQFWPLIWIAFLIINLTHVYEDVMLLLLIVIGTLLFGNRLLDALVDFWLQ